MAILSMLHTVRTTHLRLPHCPSLHPAPASAWKKGVTQEQKQFNSEVTKKGFLAYFVNRKKSKTLLKSAHSGRYICMALNMQMLNQEVKTMKTSKVISRVFVLTLVSVAFIAQIPYAQDYPAPFDQIKELAVSQGKKDNDGCYLWGMENEGVEFWVAHCLSDKSVAFGKGVPDGSYRWGIACGPQGDYVFLESVMGQVVTAVPVESEGAIGAADEFFKEVETLIRKPITSPTGNDQIVV
jgi:hypothetical protein